MCYGVSPFLKSKLTAEICQAQEFVIIFDEALNKISQHCQMDFLVRFWDKEKNQVVTKYYTSSFLSNATADNLLEAFCQSFEMIGLKRLLAISMDGPNVNWSLFTKMASYRELNDYPGLLNMGSCGLHVVHGALQTGHKKTGWDLNATLRYAYYFFRDSPARRAQFQTLCSSNLFPKKFCGTRWTKNSGVVQRFLLVLPNLEKYCQLVKPQPDTISFRNLKKAFTDPLLRAKLHFFLSVCSILEPFLHRFQSGDPMLPFLYEALSDTQTTLAHRYYMI